MNHFVFVSIAVVDTVYFSFCHIRCYIEYLLLGLNKVNGCLNSGNSLNFIIRDFNIKLLLQTHDKFNGIKRIGTKIIHETGSILEITIGVQLTLDKFTNLLLNTEKGCGSGSGYIVCRGEGGSTGHKGGNNKGLSGLLLR